MANPTSKVDHTHSRRQLLQSIAALALGTCGSVASDALAQKYDSSGKDPASLDRQRLPSSTSSTTPSDGKPQGGQTLDTYYMLNSLHNHDAGAGNANTSTGNWLHRLARQAPNGGNNITMGSFMGFANGWELPPRDAGQEEIRSPYVRGTSWANANQIEVVGFVPDNFEGPRFAPDKISGLGFAYTPRLLQLIDAWEANAPNANRRYIVHAGWKLLSGYGATSVAALTPPMISNWIKDSLGQYDAWQNLIVAQLRAARPKLDIRIHNVNRALMLTYRDTVVNTLPPSALFEDLAPHGYPTLYFLAAVAEYIELFNEKPPEKFVFNATWGVNPIVMSNYQKVVDFMWDVV